MQFKEEFTIILSKEELMILFDIIKSAPCNSTKGKGDDFVDLLYEVLENQCTQ